MAELGVLDDYLDAGFGFDHVEIFMPDGNLVARVPSPKLVEGYPANVGISRRALHKVLGDTALEAGAHDPARRRRRPRSTMTATGVDVRFSDGSQRPLRPRDRRRRRLLGDARP